MWGERGLVATFFADLSQHGNGTVIEFLTEIVEFNPSLKINRTDVVSIDIIIEPGFGNQGFGHPDAVIVVCFKNKPKKVFIIEAKLSTYEKACMDNTDKSKEKFNSSLNGQLELNYRLSIALSEFKANDARLIEPELISQKYDKDKRRKVYKKYVLDKIVSKLSGECLRNYYYIVLINDKCNPFINISPNPNLLPQLFDEDGKDCWTDMQSQFGWVNYDKIEGFLENKNLFRNTLEINRVLLN
jgi:hypothetical protein